MKNLIQEQVATRINAKGQEVLSQKPVVLPTGVKISDTNRLRAMVRNELSRQAAYMGQETFDEADDFDIEDDPIDPTTPWELQYDHEQEPRPSQLPKKTAPKTETKPKQSDNKPLADQMRDFLKSLTPEEKAELLK